MNFLDLTIPQASRPSKEGSFFYSATCGSRVCLEARSVFPPPPPPSYLTPPSNIVYPQWAEGAWSGLTFDLRTGIPTSTPAPIALVRSCREGRSREQLPLPYCRLRRRPGRSHQGRAEDVAGGDAERLRTSGAAVVRPGSAAASQDAGVQVTRRGRTCHSKQRMGRPHE